MHLVIKGRCIACGASVIGALKALDTLHRLSALEAIQPGLDRVLSDLKKRRAKNRTTISRILKGEEVKPKRTSALRRDLELMLQLFKLNAEFRYRLGHAIGLTSTHGKRARKETRQHREVALPVKWCTIALEVLDCTEPMLSIPCLVVLTVDRTPLSAFFGAFERQVIVFRMQITSEELEEFPAQFQLAYGVQLLVRRTATGIDLFVGGNEQGVYVPEGVLNLVHYAGDDLWQFNPESIPDEVTAVLRSRGPYDALAQELVGGWIGDLIKPADESANHEDRVIQTLSA